MNQYTNGNQKMKDLSGLKFENLTVITFSHKQNRAYWWNCLCDCGVTFKIRTSELVRKTQRRVQSCGCLRTLRETESKKELPFKAIYNRYKATAKYKSFEFKLEYNDVVKLVRSDCVYCGISPDLSITQSKGVYYNGIDRIDSSKGYTLDNVVTCCWSCNTAKNSFSVDEFIDRCIMIADRWKRQPVIVEPEKGLYLP